MAARASGSTGDFAGNLTLAAGGPGIDSSHAYFVNSTATLPVPIEMPDQDSFRPPPEIAVPSGWNLVPVISILPLGAADDGSEVQFGTEIDSDVYLGAHGTTWSRGFTFELGRWANVLPGDDEGIAGDGGIVEVGRGYWVFFLTDKTLVP